MTVTVSRLEPEDHAAVRHLSVAPDQRDFVASNHDSISEALGDAACVPLILRAEGQPVGFAMYALDQDDGNYWLYRLMIDTRFQGQGFGRAALHAVTALMARLPGCAFILLGVNPENRRAAALYESFGFRATGAVIEGERVMRYDLPMMKLYYQTHSPYARKALVFAHEAGLAHRLEVIHHETSPTRRNDTVYAENPLGKVPVLIRPGETPIFDSDVICAYLDTLANGTSLIPKDGEARWDALQLQALAQGLCQSGIQLRWETNRRPVELRYPPLAQGYEEKLSASYDWLEAELDVTAPVHVGHVALATALDWIAFRELTDFRQGRPRLARWFDDFARRPSMQATPLSGETHD